MAIDYLEQLEDPESAARDAVEHADRALDLDDMDSNVLGLAGCALADVGEIRRAMPILRNAIDLNPSNAQAHAALGATHLALVDSERAIEHLLRGIELSPLDRRLAVWYAFLAMAYVQAGQFEQAEAAAQHGCQSDHKTYMPRVLLATAYVVRGDTEKARTAFEESLRVKPDLSQDEIDHLVGAKIGKALAELHDRC